MSIEEVTDVSHKKSTVKVLKGFGLGNLEPHLVLNNVRMKGIQEKKGEFFLAYTFFCSS